MDMSSLLSPMMANIYIEYFDEISIKMVPLKLIGWSRYVDETFIIGQFPIEGNIIMMLPSWIY